MHQMHDELLKLDGQVPNGNGKMSSLVSSTDDEKDDGNWETIGSKKRAAITRTQSFLPSKLSSIFGGQLESVVKARGESRFGAPNSIKLHIYIIWKCHHYHSTFTFLLDYNQFQSSDTIATLTDC